MTMDGAEPPTESTWVPYAVSGAGATLGAVMLIEFGLILTRPGGAYDGFFVGVATSLPFIGGLIGGGYWLARSDIRRSDYSRIAAWVAGGAVGTVLFIGVINGAMRTLTPLLTVGTVRWSMAVGGSLGLVVGALQSRSIQRALEVDRARRRHRETERERDRLEEFATEVSHDLRGPLNVARGHLDLLAEDCDDPRVQQIGAALDRMEPIIEETLSLARAGQTVGETEAVELATVATESWATVEDDGGALETLETGVIEADGDRLRHLFENLFRNAIEHAGPVTVRVGVLEDQLGFYVEDDGPGVPESERDRVFQSGYSTSSEGSGVGLSIVERIVDAHGWTITLTEGADGGARFEISGVEVADETAPAGDGEEAKRAPEIG